MIAHFTSLLAGSLSTLSPCVLPALPLIVGGGGQRNKLGPLYLSLGLIVSFTLVGVTLAQFGQSLNLDINVIRYLSAIMLILAGISFVSGSFQKALQRILAPIVNKAGVKSHSISSDSFIAQFSLGFLLGGVWSPCVGPALGTAITLATNTSTLPEATLMMVVYGIGAAVPLLFVGYSSQHLFSRSKAKLMNLSKSAKWLFAFALILNGVLVLTGGDKIIEEYLLAHLPDGWLEVITSR